MNWNQAKTILIALFLVIDAFLLVTLFQIHSNGQGLSPETVSQLISILDQNHISVSPQVVESQKNTVHEISATSARNNPEAFSEHVTSALHKNGQDPALFALTFHDDFVTIEPRMVCAPFSKQDLADPKLVCQSVLTLFGLDFTNFCVLAVEQNPQTTSVTLSQRTKDQFFISPELTVTYSADALLRVRGDWLFEKPEQAGRDSESSLPSVLIDFIKNADRSYGSPITIESIQLVYTVESFHTGERFSTAIPAFALIASDGKTYLYDARNNQTAGASYFGQLPHPLPKKL